MKTFILEGDLDVVAAMAASKSSKKGQLCLQFRKIVPEWDADQIEKKLVLSLSDTTTIFQADDQGHYGGNKNPVKLKLRRILFEFED